MEEIQKFLAPKAKEMVEKLSRGEKLSAEEVTFLLYYTAAETNTRMLENLNKINENYIRLDQKIDKVREELIGEIRETRSQLERKIESLDKKIESVREELLKKIEETRNNLEKKIELNRLDLSIMAEEFYISKVISYLKESGEKIIDVDRQYVLKSGREIDALVECENKVYPVEVKLKAELNDVDDLVSKVEELKGVYTKQLIPILTGGRISRQIKDYAKAKGILII